jgi:glycosyltransferase involved in cell wall biosynthesis
VPDAHNCVRRAPRSRGYRKFRSSGVWRTKNCASNYRCPGKSGPGKLRHDLQTVVANLGLTNRVTFLGYLPEDSLPELVRHGENGSLFPEDDVQALAAAAVTILSNEPLRRQMVKKSQELIKVHDIDQVVEQYEMLYSRMLASDAKS